MSGALDLSLRFRDRLVHDAGRGEMRDGAIRYLTMRPDALMGMFARLPAPAAAAALAALAASVAEHGGRSVQAYRESGAVDPAAMMATVAGTSADLGWGIWSFAPETAGSIAVTVANSPFAEGRGSAAGPLCAPIQGILAAIGPLLLGGPVRVEETCCAAHHGADCRFEIRRAAP